MLSAATSTPCSCRASSATAWPAGRYWQFGYRVPDRPGSLAGLLADCAAVDANVLEVEHVRTGTTIRVDEVEIGLQLETRATQHCEDVLRALRSKGYQLKFG